jgi:hypothetical protein
MSNSSAVATTFAGSVEEDAGTSPEQSSTRDPPPSPSPVAIDHQHHDEEPESAHVAADSIVQDHGNQFSKRETPTNEKPKAADVSSNRLALIWSWCTSKDLYLENTGSVARDHLAVSGAMKERVYVSRT